MLPHNLQAKLRQHEGSPYAWGRDPWLVRCFHSWCSLGDGPRPGHRLGDQSLVKVDVGANIYVKYVISKAAIKPICSNTCMCIYWMWMYKFFGELFGHSNTVNNTTLLVSGTPLTVIALL